MRRLAQTARQGEVCVAGEVHRKLGSEKQVKSAPLSSFSISISEHALLQGGKEEVMLLLTQGMSRSRKDGGAVGDEEERVAR